MTVEARHPRRTSRLGAEWYVALLLIWAVLLECLAFGLAAVDRTLPPAAAVALVVAGAVAAVVLWWGVEDPGERGLSLGLFLGGLGCLWLMAAAWRVGDGGEASLSALLLPVLILLAWSKPPSADAARRAASAFAWALVVVVVCAVAAESVGLLPSWYAMSGVDELGWIEGDRAAYWLPLADLLGLDARWAGPFNHPNVAGMVGAVLVVLAGASRGAARWVIGTVGVVVLLATSSRTSMVATLSGVCVLAAAWWLRRPSRLSPFTRVMLAVLPVLIAMGIWVVVNPGLTGRTSIWPVYADLWREAPWAGLGQRGIDVAVQEGRLPDWAHHGHSLLLDTAARYGLLGLVVLGVVLGAALTAVVGAARRGRALGLALTVMLLVAGLTETTLRWLYLTVPVATLVLAVLMSAPTGSRGPAGLPRAPAPGSDPVPAREPSASVD